MREGDDAYLWHHGKLVRIGPDDHHQRLWQAWLAENGWGEPGRLRLIEGDGTMMVPLQFPPDRDHPVEPSLVRNWLIRRAYMVADERRARA